MPNNLPHCAFPYFFPLCQREKWGINCENLENGVKNEGWGFEFPHQRPQYIFLSSSDKIRSTTSHSQTHCLTATLGLLIFDKQLNDAPVWPGSMLCLLIIGEILHQDGGTNAPPKIHPVTTFSHWEL